MTPKQIEQRLRVVAPKIQSILNDWMDLTRRPAPGGMEALLA